MTTPIPTPRTDVVWRQLEEADSITETGAAAGAVVVLARQLERELEIVKKRKIALHFALGEAIKERDELRTAMAQRQFDGSARQRVENERDQWRECAVRFLKVLCDASPAVTVGLYNDAMNLYESLCQPSPTPSSPLSQDTVRAPKSAPSEEMASRLAALERSQELLLRRTDWLLAHLSDWTHTGKLTIHAGANPIRISFKTEWPADLVPTESTSISQPTPKPSASANESSR